MTEFRGNFEFKYATFFLTTIFGHPVTSYLISKKMNADFLLNAGWHNYQGSQQILQSYRWAHNHKFSRENVVIAHFRDKYVVIACFRNKNFLIAHFRDKKWYFYFYDKMSWYIMMCHDLSCYVMMYDKNVAVLFYWLPIFSINSNYVLSIAILFYR